MSGECQKCNNHALECWCSKCEKETLVCVNTDKVNHPSHYKGHGLECIQVIEAFNLGFNLGNAVKYILRAGKKGSRKEDLQKAVWYLNRETENDVS